jgi:hypothetical protein
MNFSALFMSDARLTYIDAVAITALCFILHRLYRSRHPQDEHERKERRGAILGLASVLL